MTFFNCMKYENENQGRKGVRVMVTSKGNLVFFVQFMTFILF